MQGARAWWLVGAGFVGLAILVAAAWAGWLGTPTICGADEAPLCVPWPPLASLAVWALFGGSFLILAVWQVAEWRRPNDPTERSED